MLLNYYGHQDLDEMHSCTKDRLAKLNTHKLMSEGMSEKQMKWLMVISSFIESNVKVPTEKSNYSQIHKLTIPQAVFFFLWLHSQKFYQIIFSVGKVFWTTKTIHVLIIQSYVNKLFDSPNKYKI